MTTHLVWFRADLRLHDNIALAAACRSQNARVLAVFIATPDQWRQHDMAPRQASYLRAHCNGLQQGLAERGIPLIYEEVSDFAAQSAKVQQLCEQHAVTHLFTTINTNATSSNVTDSSKKRSTAWSVRALTTA